MTNNFASHKWMQNQKRVFNHYACWFICDICGFNIYGPLNLNDELWNERGSIASCEEHLMEQILK